MGSETLNVPHGSSLSIHQASIKNMFKDELFSRVRARRDSDDDDEDEDIGLPRSPCTSPTTVDVLTQGLKEKSSKSQTTCSAGSLISMGSSENDEDSTGHSSGHSSRMSLIDRRSLDSDGELDLNQSAPLNHNAAHHKIAIKPKRTHGLPRRRKNQIAAAKLITLPSTPEVVEDNGKFMQKLETIEVPQRNQESTSSSRGENASLQSSELNIMHTSFSCSEMSAFTETLMQDKTSVSETNVNIVKRNRDYDSKFFTEDNVKKSDCRKSNSDFSEKLNLSDDNILKQEHIEKDNYSSIKQTIIQKREEFILQEVKRESIISAIDDDTFTILSNTENAKQIDFNNTLSNQMEDPIKVSSLIKNLEMSESFKNIDQLPKSTEILEETCDKNESSNEQIIPLFKPAEKLDDTVKIDRVSDIFKQIRPSTEISNIEKPIEHSATSLKENSLNASIIPDVGKLNIDCEFILKPLKKECAFDGDLDTVSKEILSSSEKENVSISSAIFEEESIMTSKTLSMGVEEGGIFVSHHASIQNDLKDILVTEAHNYAAVEEKSEVFIQNSISKNSNADIDSNESWISSIGISSSKPDVTVNSPFSMCNSKMSDDKITISVNSKQTTKHTIGSQRKDIKNLEEGPKSTTFTKPDIRQKVAMKEAISGKALQKANIHDEQNIPTNMKNMNSQKRVSVEIVPFSQRMKERKYQPITFANKEVISDKEKKISNTVVERKLSDRKVTVKGKEVDKSNNRHSFSGVISSDKKEVSIDKKPLKPDKVQYPVQIRIHKTVPTVENKDKTNQPTQSKDRKSSITKNFSKEEKSQMQTSKNKDKESKISREEKFIAENTKWEVKIQPAATHSTSPISNVEESYSTKVSEKQLCSRSDLQQPTLTENKEILLNQELESTSLKTNENSCKVPKEMPVLSDDPEPELLRVFARRSIKQKHCDKDKVNDEEKPISDVSSEESFHVEKSEDSKELVSVSHSSTVIKISDIPKPHIKPDLKKKSKSFSEKERISTRSVSPLKEIHLIHREPPTKSTFDVSSSTETTHPRQRIVNVPDVPLNLPPDVSKCLHSESKLEFSPSTKEEIQQKVNLTTIPQSTSSVNGSLTSLGTVKETHDILSGKEAHAPPWLQLAQQRRELREQRERLLLGGSPNSFMDASNKPSRSSKVWDMVNNFQKLQMT